MGSRRLYKLTFFAVPVLNEFSPWKILVHIRVRYAIRSILVLKCPIYPYFSIVMQILWILRFLSISYIIHFHLMRRTILRCVWRCFVSIEWWGFKVIYHVAIRPWHNSLRNQIIFSQNLYNFNQSVFLTNFIFVDSIIAEDFPLKLFGNMAGISTYYSKQSYENKCWPYDEETS